MAVCLVNGTLKADVEVAMAPSASKLEIFIITEDGAMVRRAELNSQVVALRSALDARRRSYRSFVEQNCKRIEQKIIKRRRAD